MTISCVASIQMTSKSEVSHNLAVAKKLIQQAADQGAQLVVLPEMFAIMGIDQSAKLKYQEVFGHGQIQDFLQEEAIKHRIWIVGGTLPLRASDGKVYAACLLWNDQGECVARYDKIHLFDVTLSEREYYSESTLISPGQQVVVVPTPFGQLGLAVCYDVRFPELFRHMLQKGVEFIALPAAFTFVTGQAHWDVLVRARAIENLSYMITACQTGIHENGRQTYGHSMIVGPWGEIKACLENEEGVIIAQVNLAELRKRRDEFPVLNHRRSVYHSDF